VIQVPRAKKNVSSSSLAMMPFIVKIVDCRTNQILWEVSN